MYTGKSCGGQRSVAHGAAADRHLVNLLFSFNKDMITLKTYIKRTNLIHQLQAASLAAFAAAFFASFAACFAAASSAAFSASQRATAFSHAALSHAAPGLLV